MSGHKLHMPENMDSFEKGWTLRDNAAGAKARLAGAAENKSKVGNLDPAESRPGGFLPSIGGSATARMSASKPIGLTPHPPSGSQSARAAGKLPSLSSATHPGAGAQQRERLVRQRKVDTEIFKKAFAVIDKDGSGAVDPDEIVSCLKIFGKDVDRKRFWQVFKEADRDNNESLDIDEFVDMMLRVTEKTRAAKAKRSNALSRKFKAGAVQAAAEKMKEKERAKYQGNRRPKKVEAAEGSQWMDQALAQHRGLADIYASRKRLQRMALGAGLIDADEDPRMRTMLGRRVIKEEMKAAAERERRAAEPQVAMAALDTFATMFGNAPPPEKPAPAPAPPPAIDEDGVDAS